MTPDQYWSGDPWLYAAYREAKRRADEERDWEQWTMGMYVYDAVLRAAPVINALSKRREAHPWLDAPYGRERPVSLEDERAAEEAGHQRLADWMLSARPRG